MTDSKPTNTEAQTADARETLTPLFYVMAIVFGVLCGVVHVAVQDPLLTALGVTATTMFLGTARPQRPWRWTLLVGLPVPLVLIVAKLTGYYQTFTRATLAGSILIILPGIAGAVGGSFMRKFYDNVFKANRSA